MSISAFAVRRPVTTYMIFLAVVILGLVSLNRLSIDMLPRIDFPSISIFTTYEGVGPEEIETLITRPIEEAVSTIQGIERIESYSVEGRSRVQLRFTWGTTLDNALSDVRAAVERIRDTLPEEAAAPVVFKFDLTSFPILYLTLSGDMEPWRLRHLAEDKIKYRLERVDGVAQADLRGGLRREIHVDLDADRLSALGLTAAEVAEGLRRENVNLPAGDVRESNYEVIVRTLGEFENVSVMEDTIVAVRQGAPIRIKDIGRVNDSYEEPINTVLVDGKPGIRIAISKLSDANTVEVAARVRQETARINRDYPNVKLKARFDTSNYIQQSISNLEQGVLYGAGLAILVLFIFLRSLSATVIVATSIPIAAIATFALMYTGGFTLNMISFGGLALGIGMLVDNSIVILENIQRKKEEGASPREAAVRGSEEVSTAIVASTMTTLSIFVPVIFITGFAGIFFGQMAFVVSFALLCSLVVALMLIPVLSSKGRSGPANGRSKSSVNTFLGKRIEALEQAYARFLNRALGRRKTVYLLANILLIASVLLIPSLGTELMPVGDQGEIQIEAELPIGTPLEKTEEAVLAAGSIIQEETPELDALMSVVGPPGFWSQAGSNGASMRVNLVDLTKRDRSSEEVANAIRPQLGRIPDFKARVTAGESFWLFRLLRGGGERISIDVLGFEARTAADLAAQVAATIGEVPGVVDVDIDRKEGNREAVIRIDRDRAADLGLSVGQAGDVISTYVLGKAATYYREGGDEFRVLVRLREEDRYRTAQLEQLPLITPSKGRITLGDIAKIERRSGPVSIRRLNQERIITVSAGFKDRDLGSINSDIREALNRIEVPDGFELKMGGEFEEQRETFAQLLIGIVLAIILVYMVMASLFESFLHPLIMLLSIPFAIVGVILSLVLTGTTFNVFSFMGIIVLCGVVVNNAIVLVDYINLLRRDTKHDLVGAVIEASKRRLRPILMTTLTTVLALIPVALGVGEGGEMQAPLARVVVGGLITSTMISLIFVPTLYTSLETIKARKHRREVS